MKTPHTNSTPHPAIISQKLFELERCGKYEDALSEISDIWTDTTQPPDVSGFEPQDAAEILLRCGSLIGFYGHTKQILEAQQLSKDLLTDSKYRFIELRMPEKAAECDTSLALACWRSGELADADIWIEEALSYDLPVSNPTRLFTHVTRSLINLANQRYQENIEIAAILEADFRRYADPLLNGNFCTNIGLSMKNAGRIPEALDQFELARFYHERSRHKAYLGNVENSLAQLYKTERRFDRAHECIDRATKIYAGIDDKTREGFSLDTKALIYFEEGRHQEAFETIETSISILERTENAAYRMEAFLTRSKILLYLDNFASATLSLIDAVEIARVQIGEERVRSLIEEFEKTLNERNSPKPQAAINEKDMVAEEDFELVLPPSLAHYNDYQGVWINNRYLETVGLTKGSLAIIVNEKIGRGDLIALSEIENDAVSCGFYDADFGIVCLEGVDSEPQLFEENQVRILGKIVGVCRSEENADGKYIVKPLNL
ncbi:MAG: hypothetical protein H7070_08735 [Saprospiraceae bacterium]|nr:hypothetical protein [Pyrinomonadaceae bacterium]